MVSYSRRRPDRAGLLRLQKLRANQPHIPAFPFGAGLQRRRRLLGSRLRISAFRPVAICVLRQGSASTLDTPPPTDDGIRNDATPGWLTKNQLRRFWHAGRVEPRRECNAAVALTPPINHCFRLGHKRLRPLDELSPELFVRADTPHTLPLAMW